MILPIELVGKGFTPHVGGIACADISMILPDMENPDSMSVIYTALLPTGLTVKGNAKDLCGEWYAWTQPIDEAEDDDV